MKFIVLFLAALASQATQAANLRSGKSIVDLALATPDLSTLLTALKAADFTSVRGSFAFAQNQHPILDWYLMRVERGADGQLADTVVRKVATAMQDAYAAECKM